MIHPTVDAANVYHAANDNASHGGGKGGGGGGGLTTCGVNIGGVNIGVETSP